MDVKFAKEGRLRKSYKTKSTLSSNQLRVQRLLCQILNPHTTADHKVAHNTLDDLHKLADSVKRKDGHIGVSAQNKGQRHHQAPHKAAVKQKGDTCFATGAQSEIGGVDIGIEGDHCRGNHDQPAG